MFLVLVNGVVGGVFEKEWQAMEKMSEAFHVNGKFKCIEVYKKIEGYAGKLLARVVGEPY